VLAIRRTVVDLRESTICFSGWDLQKLINEMVLPVLEGRDWKTALVVREPTQFGVSRQYQVFAEQYSKDSIFSCVEDAGVWICKHPIEDEGKSGANHTTEPGSPSRAGSS
jgi:hypothetical protein